MLIMFRIQLAIAAVILNIGLVHATPKAVRGSFDLRHIDTPQKFILKTNGEWEFYWNKMLHSDDFRKSEIRPDCYGKVPSYWTDYKESIVKTEKYGYATYRLNVILPKDFREPLGFDIPVFDSSYELYLNGKMVASNGKPGKNEATTRPEYKRNLVKFLPQSDTVEIIINVANYHHRRGGFWLPLRMGTYPVLLRSATNIWAAEWAIITVLIGFSLFFLFFFILSPKDKMMLFISLTTAALAMRPLFTSHYLIQNFINLDWNWIVKFEYIGLFLIIIGWSWFIVNFYPSKLMRVVTWINTGIYPIAIILTLILPVRIFSYSTYAFYPCMFFLISYQLYKSLIGALNKNYVDLMYFAAFGILLFGGIHDIRVAGGKGDSSAGYLLTYLIVVFVLSQAAILLYRWIHAFNEKEKLQKELEFMNRNLEILVNERTQELKTRNEEIEKQNSQIALQNKQLSDTISLKNRIFSLIAHDLRSPVVNILYMLNLLKEKEYKEKYDEFANSSIRYAQMVISLLENMLVWGRGQEDKIKYSPAKYELSDIVLTNLSIFKETADNKDVSITFTQTGKTIAYCDKDLLDIIIRNILSNAVKYTYRGGRIHILLKDRTDENEGILLKICDNGMGMPESRRLSILTSAEIESTPGTEKEKGTGFGLKLCHDLVKINNGTISVESHEGEGTCFSIILPVE